jgi:ATP-dependent protease ClpP protease subunit
MIAAARGRRCDCDTSKGRETGPSADCRGRRTARLASGAEIDLGNKLELDIWIRGQITSDDPAKFRSLFANLKPRKVLDRNRTVNLNSPGGDVYAAMDIGRQIRVRSMRTKVAKGDTCVSACVFVFVGGVNRSLGGQLGIHRPYSTETGYTTLQDADKQYKRMDASVRAYFKEMNISETLADDMMRIRPHDVRFLDYGGAEQYGLNDEDPAHAEAEASSAAETYGISKAEYFRRERRAEKECVMDIEEFVQCYDAILFGISRPELARRKARAEQECGSDTSSPNEIRKQIQCKLDVWHGIR